MFKPHKLLRFAHSRHLVVLDKIGQQFSLPGEEISSRIEVIFTHALILQAGYKVVLHYIIIIIILNLLITFDKGVCSLS